MKLKQIGANRTLLVLDNGNEIFFSYETPVAARIDGNFFRTDKNWSVTTNKHISQYLNGTWFNKVPQAHLDAIMQSDKDNANFGHVWAVQS